MPIVQHHVLLLLEQDVEVKHFDDVSASNAADFIGYIGSADILLLLVELNDEFLLFVEVLSQVFVSDDPQQQVLLPPSLNLFYSITEMEGLLTELRCLCCAQEEQ